MRLRSGEYLFDFGTRQLFRGREPVAVSPKAFLSSSSLPPAARMPCPRRSPSAPLARQLRRRRESRESRRGASGRARRGCAQPPRHPDGPALRLRVLGRCRARGRAGVVGRVERRLQALWGDREILLQEGENILGREREAIAWIDVHSVSRRHARIAISGGRATLEDFGKQERHLPAGECRRGAERPERRGSGPGRNRRDDPEALRRRSVDESTRMV